MKIRSFIDSFANLLYHYNVIVPGPIPLDMEVDLLKPYNRPEDQPPDSEYLSEYLNYKGAWMPIELFCLTEEYLGREA